MVGVAGPLQNTARSAVPGMMQRHHPAKPCLATVLLCFRSALVCTCCAASSLRAALNRERPNVSCTCLYRVQQSVSENPPCYVMTRSGGGACADQARSYTCAVVMRVRVSFGKRESVRPGGNPVWLC